MKKSTVIFSRFLMLVYICLVAYLCFGHFDNIPDIAKKLRWLETDKLFHFCMFLPFPILSYYSVGKEFKTPFKAMAFTLSIFALGCIIAASTELGQGLTTYRTPDKFDFIADSAALAISSLAVFVIILIKEVKMQNQ